MYKILIINGPNMNLLGLRQPDIYGKETYTDLLNYLKETAHELHVEIDTFQSNHEGILVDTLQESYKKYDGIVINPAAYTHTSVALLDVLLAIPIPAVEVHLSAIEKREAFRQFSYTAKACIAQISGLGFGSYRKGLESLIQALDLDNSKENQ